MLKLFYQENDSCYYVGDLYFEKRGNKEIFSFEYSNEWLKSDKKINIDPELYLFKGRQYASKGIFGFVRDMIPDRFGKYLLDDKERKLAVLENRLPRKLFDSDYLLSINDLTRIGALRIQNEEGEFVSIDKDNSVPPYIYLRDIEYASRDFELTGSFDKKEYQRLLLPGSSLGGARPKANIYYNDELWIAKFPSINDTYDVEAWEGVSLELAALCHIKVSSFKLEKYSNIGSTLLTKRFDRKASCRIHYSSFMTLLEAEDGDSGNYSFLDLVSTIRSSCNNIKEDLEELYRRLIFSYLINNTDNHLKNHGVIYSGSEMKLAPLFDVNPTFYESSFALPLVNNSVLNKEAIIKEANYYYLSKDEATTLYDSIGLTLINNLSSIAQKYNLRNKEIETLITIIKARL